MPNLSSDPQSSSLHHRYLFVPNVLSAAVSRRCTMLHPGYGFLAENAGFVDICREHGINFIGPNVSGLFMMSYDDLLCISSPVVTIVYLCFSV